MAIGTSRTYLKLRIAPVALLLLHLVVRLFSSGTTPLADLYIYNAVGVLAALVAFYAPVSNDKLARVLLSIALFIWTLGSITTTWNDFYRPFFWSNFSDLCYILFYPLILLSLIRALTAHRTFRFAELLEVVIITFGLSTLIAYLFLKSAMTHFTGDSTTVFLSIVYPIGDVVLLAIALFIVLAQRRALRSFLFLLGIAIFTATDLYFLFKSASSQYNFGELSDDGWLLGLIVMAEALWHRGGEEELSDRVIASLTTIAMICSGLILAISALRQTFLPTIVLIPAIATIALAVARMAIALQQARTAASNLVLARIDELTELANRRRFIHELTSLGRESATLLLLDLDGFKMVNDTLGHEAGDELLRQIALRFSRVTPAGSLLARLGGDEFGVIVPGNPRTGVEVGMALASTVSYPFIVAGHEINVGVSIGRVINDGALDLMARADKAMYEAKRSGGGMVLWQP